MMMELPSVPWYVFPKEPYLGLAVAVEDVWMVEREWHRWSVEYAREVIGFVGHLAGFRFVAVGGTMGMVVVDVGLRGVGSEVILE